jgi:hypothetical protein
MGILLYHHGTLVTITSLHGNTVLLYYHGNTGKIPQGVEASTIKILNNSNDNNVWYAAFP